jgi:rRNA maturation protein Nop10
VSEKSDLKGDGFMSEWTKERKCEDCGNTFSLSDYGTSTARATAETLEGEMRRYDNKINYFLADKCPKCYKKFMVDVVQEEVKRQAEQRKNKKPWQFWK